ncbi:MAG: alpha/beta fold hydrolase [Vicingaceae bacterium]|nr:alpha/beta fold hydrolase [Vicingaceae bacterium]
MRLNYKKLGTGQPLIIIHGLFGSLDNWMTFAKTMSEKYEVYLVDARNHGQSPHSNVFNIQVMADDLKEFIDKHQLIDSIILGHSMGGKIAMQFAVEYSHLVSKLIIVDIAPKAYPVHHELIIEGLLSLDFNVIKTRNAADEKLIKYIPDLSVRQFLLKNLYWIEKERLAFRFNLEVIAKNIAEIGVAINSNGSQFIKPTLFIRGEKSNYILDSDREEIKSIFPKAVIGTIKNSGHWIHAEQPEAFLSMIKNFIA